MKALLVLVLLSAASRGFLYNVDQPVPVSLKHAEYYAGVRLWGEGGAMVRFGIGLFDRLTLGVAYGGNRLIGSAEPGMYPRPEFLARGAILTEQGYFPDFIVGFESQGLDHYDDDYDVLPKGGYASLGKTITPTNTYVQLGVNYWRKVSGFAVVNQALPAGFEVMVEYDLGLNDNRPELARRGYLNAGVGWTFNDQIRFSLGLRDILGNRDATRLNRVIDLSFRNHF